MMLSSMNWVMLMPSRVAGQLDAGALRLCGVYQQLYLLVLHGSLLCTVRPSRFDRIWAELTL